MQLSIRFPTQELQAAVLRIETALNREREPVRRALLDKLRSLALKDFDAKSRGGAGADGTTWKRKQAPGRIGIDTGELRASLRVRSGGVGADVWAEYTAPHAEVFDAQRRLLPEEYPDAWKAALEPAVEQWAEKLIQEKLDQVR